MFGAYANSVTKEKFKYNLAGEGWKYFELNNLNELFSMKYKVLVEAKVVSEVMLTAIDRENTSNCLVLMDE